MKASRSSETSITIWQSRRCNIAEDLNFQQHSRENLKSCMSTVLRILQQSVLLNVIFHPFNYKLILGFIMRWFQIRCCNWKSPSTARIVTASLQYCQHFVTEHNVRVSLVW
jgi:hypothetical protein